MELFANIINNLNPLTGFGENTILDVCLRSEYTSDICSSCVLFNKTD